MTNMSDTLARKDESRNRYREFVAISAKAKSVMEIADELDRTDSWVKAELRKVRNDGIVLPVYEEERRERKRKEWFNFVRKTAAECKLPFDELRYQQNHDMGQFEVS